MHIRVSNAVHRHHIRAAREESVRGMDYKYAIMGLKSSVESLMNIARKHHPPGSDGDSITLTDSWTREKFSIKKRHFLACADEPGKKKGSCVMISNCRYKFHVTETPDEIRNMME